MEITLQLQRETAHELQHGLPPDESTLELLKVAEECGVRIQPVHPQEADAELATFFCVQVADAESTERVRERLSHCGCVEAAYVKPPDSPP